VTGQEARKLREKMDMSQTDFWSKLGVSQSASSRYESGRRVPMPLKTLLMIAYGNENKAVGLFNALRKWGR
jgi:transcriptional regulator with XRE-family HTH domain